MRLSTQTPLLLLGHRWCWRERWLHWRYLWNQREVCLQRYTVYSKPSFNGIMGKWPYLTPTDICDSITITKVVLWRHFRSRMLPSLRLRWFAADDLDLPFNVASHPLTWTKCVYTCTVRDALSARQLFYFQSGWRSKVELFVYEIRTISLILMFLRELITEARSVNWTSALRGRRGLRPWSLTSQ